jgi:hypothetical protein
MFSKLFIRGYVINVSKFRQTSTAMLIGYTKDISKGFSIREILFFPEYRNVENNFIYGPADAPGGGINGFRHLR